MRAITHRLRGWWPLPLAIALSSVAEAVFTSRHGDLGEHAAGHLASSKAIFSGLAMVAVMLWATPRARRQLEVWLASAAWLAALVVVLIGNLQVVTVLGTTDWVDAGAVAFEPPGVEAGHGLAAVGAWTGVGAAVVMTVVLLVRGHVSRRMAAAAVVLSVVVPPFIMAGAGVNVLAIALCVARWRRETDLAMAAPTGPGLQAQALPSQG